MKVHTNIRRLDLIIFNLTLLPRVRSTYVTIGVIAFAVATFILLKHGSPETARNWMILVVASLGGGVGGMLAGIIISMVLILTTSSKANGILGEHEYEITPEGLLEKTNANEGLSRWSGIQEVRKAGSFILFRISGYLFHIIPRRSFETDEDFHEFLGMAKDKWRSAA
jgi:YcxB-like protein